MGFRQIKKMAAAFSAHGGGGWALVAWGDDHHIRPCDHLIIKDDPFIIYRQGGDMRGMAVKQLTQIGVKRVFNHDLFRLVHQQLCQQEQGVLCAHRHQNLGRLHMDPSARQAVRANVIHQQRVIMQAKIPCRDTEIPDPQRLPRTVAPFRMGKQGAIGLSVIKRILIFAPVQRLSNNVQICWRGDKFFGPIDFIG